VTRTRPKQIVLAALSHDPDFVDLPTLPTVDSKAGSELLRWLDQSGVALVLLRRLQKHNAVPLVSGGWRQALEARQARNIRRTEDMLQEARRIQNAFLSFGIRAVCLKGFSLSPDFCEDPFVRHQVDFDFLVSQGSVHTAAEALCSCGYRTAKVNESSETCFVTPLRYIPSAQDDLYAVQRHRQVDLHVSIWEPYEWLSVEVPQDCLDFAQPQQTNGLEFLSLSLEDKVLFHTLHLFRHALRSWIRVSWLLEIANCIKYHDKNLTLWNRVIERAGTGRPSKTIFAFVLGMVNRLFCTPIPEPLNLWQSTAMSSPLKAWLNDFALDWVLSDWPGSLNNLFLASEFIPHRRDRMKYWQSRLLPNKTRTPLGSIASATTKSFMKVQAAHLRYVARRAAVHLTDIAVLPRQQIRWRRALASTRTPL
jgi:hypothetical protein